MKTIIGIAFFITGIAICDKTDADDDIIDLLSIFLVLAGIMIVIFSLITG